jgi:hypothetical protein
MARNASSRSTAMSRRKGRARTSECAGCVVSPCASPKENDTGAKAGTVSGESTPALTIHRTRYAHGTKWWQWRFGPKTPPRPLEPIGSLCLLAGSQRRRLPRTARWALGPGEGLRAIHHHPLRVPQHRKKHPQGQAGDDSDGYRGSATGWRPTKVSRKGSSGRAFRQHFATASSISSIALSFRCIAYPCHSRLFRPCRRRPQTPRGRLQDVWS